MREQMEVTEPQWHGFKTLFRNEWWQWSEAKRKQELRIWAIRACYLVEYDSDERLIMVYDE